MTVAFSNTRASDAAADTVVRRRPWIPRLTPARRRSLVGLMFVLPGVAPLCLFVIYPAFNSLWLSLTDWDLSAPPQFQGIQNYLDLAANQQFLHSVLTTAEFAVGVAIPSAVLAFVVAVLLDARVRFTAWYLPLLFFPAVLPSVVSAILWGIMYQGNGVVNNALGTRIGWLTDPTWALPSLIILLVWTNLGYYSVIMLAGVRGVPREYYEAARTDGAGWFQLIRHITLPLVRPALLFILVIATADSLTMFVYPYLLTRGGPGDATRMLSELIYETAFSFTNIGKAAAMAIVLLVAALSIAAVQFRLLRSSHE